MPRLGRQRRSPAKLTRSVSTPTPTPLVRNRTIVEADTARSWRWRVLGRGRRIKPTILRAPPPPLLAYVRPKTIVVSWRLHRNLPRQQHRQPRLERAVSTPTPTPLVREGVQVQADVRRRGHRLVRLGQRRRLKPNILRAPSVPTVTPLVRRRLVLNSNAGDRAHRVRFFRSRGLLLTRGAITAPLIVQPPHPPLVIPTGRRAAIRVRVFNRRRPHIILRPNVAAPTSVYVRSKIVTSHSSVRVSTRAHAFAQRGAHLARGVSTPTPTPLVKPTVILARGRGRAARIRALTIRHRTHAQRPPIVVAAPARRAATPIVSRNTGRAARARFHQQTRATITRAVVQPLPSARPHVPIVSHNAARAARVRTHIVRGAIITRAGIEPVRTRPPILSRTATRTAQRIRIYNRHRAHIVTRPRPVRVSIRASRTPILARNGRRAAVVRAFYGRHGPRIQTATQLGSAAVPTVQATLVLRDFTEATVALTDKPAAQLALRDLLTTPDATVTLRDFNAVTLTLRDVPAAELELTNHSG